MLMLTRRIRDDINSESVNIHLTYSSNLALRRMLVKYGIDPVCLDSLHDTISVRALRVSNPTGSEMEVLLGFDAPRHIEIVRSEIDVDI